ncbi:hypothetical protein [Hymenobacter latericus]|uniref:hypothetical protein n=1 Tax=Hymenobacter sp. YIM 151858-1 TaxID=2987688 RepID=UPI0022260B20|nr:hypothetical protein [Hymenobacter sp. YIM 151858-1]UYZ59405.1 hypothetical protein OIS50_01060 [Hymenobacter sp. YIM 151858-1]
MQYSRYRVSSASERGAASGQRLHSAGSQAARSHAYRHTRHTRPNHDGRHAHERDTDRTADNA